MVAAQTEDGWGYFDKTGKTIIPLVYEDSATFNEGLAAVNQDSKWGYIDKKAKLVIPYQRGDVFSFFEGLCAV